MTPERIAELRELAEGRYKRAAQHEEDVDQLTAAVPELLDALEAAQHAASVFCEAHIADVNDDDVHICPCCEAGNQSDRADSLATQLQESEAENERLRRDLGRVAPTEYRCLKPKGWLCGLGYGHAGPCMAVNHPHPLGSD